MSGWASLSGYLHIKPGGGGLSILKSRKRLWCVLEESQGRLLYFKSEDDARNKPPIGYIEIRGAAITLDMDSHNQFIIIVDGKEILLTAENHESMMIWMMALQARRDQFALAEKSRTSSTSTENDLDLDTNFLEVVESRERVGFDLSFPDRMTAPPSPVIDDIIARKRMNYLRSSSDLSIVRMRNDVLPTIQTPQRGHKPLEATHSLQGQPHVATVGFLGLSPDWRRHQLRKMGETIDNGHPSEKTVFEKDRSLSLPPLLEESALSYLNPGSRQLSLSMRAQRTVHNEGEVIWSSSSTSTDNSDDVCTDSGHRKLSRSASDRESLNSKVVVSGSDTATEQSSDSANTVDGDRVSELEKELIATKCELAKVLNRQSCFQEILKQKDEIIEDLDEKLGSRTTNSDGYDSKKRVTAANKEHQERVRVLQNQNRFLNEEVRRLAKLRGQEHDKIKIQESKVRKLEADIEVWKLEYISLIQSSIRFTGTDTMDDAELSLFGGDRHKHRIISLLEEARKINPSLPTFELLSSGEVHVDSYGFKHHFSDEGLLLHYLCQELSQHFLCQASSYEKHQRNWLQHLKNNSKNIMANKKTLKALVRDGIPDVHRKQVWKAFVMAQVEDVVLEKGAHYYRSLCSAVPDSPLAARYRKQISLDLMRTMPSNVKFSTQGSKGIMDLQDVLLAFCIHNPQVGYCQGMNFLVAMALLFMDAQDAFWSLVAVTERYHSPSYFDHNLLGAQADQMVLHDLMSEKLSELAKHLDAIDIEISTVTLNWFLALFFDAVPFQTLLRIWDCFLLEGPKVLFRFSLAILHIHSKEIILKCDTISVMRHLKTCARITYDVDGLVRVAFKTLKPFTRRQDIVSKQTCYLNALKEKYRWRDMQRVAFAERENMFLRMECDADKYTGFECCTATKPGEAWVAYREPPNAKICIVDCKERTMTDTDITFDTRVMSMVCVNDEMVLIGTLSWFVFAYNQATKEMLWQQRLHDAVLSMEVYQDDDGDKSQRLFAGLADGTVAIFEALSPSCTSYDLFYLPIGQSPVTCLRLLGNKLWCACGNNVSIIHASTLDPKDRFTVSANPYDTILSLVPGLPGVWISVRGSSVLELWDKETLSCRMLYDTRTGRFPNLRKEDDTYFNAARITSILSLDYSVWVGTGEGILITFDVFTPAQKTPSESSPFMSEAILGTDMDIQTWRASSQRSDCESLARLIEVEKRVKEIYKERQSSGTDNMDGNIGDSDAPYIEMAIKGDNLDSSIQNIKGRFQPEKIVKKNSTDHQKDPVIVKSFTSQIDFQEKKLDLSSSKTDLAKTFSADSAKTDLSMKTNTSGLSSTYSHQSDTSDHAVLDNASLHDSGFVQLSGPGSESTEHSLNTSLQEDGSKSTVIPGPLESGGDNNNLPPGSQPAVDYGTQQGSLDDRSTRANLQGPWSHETGNENCEMRQTRRSEDSGVSSLNERIGDDLKGKSGSFIHKGIVKGNAEFVNNLKNIQIDEVGSKKSLESHINESLEHYSNSDIKIAGGHISSTERIKNGQSVFSNGRSVSEESSKTNESDDVFQDFQGKQDAPDPQQQVMPHQVEDGKQVVDTWVRGQKVVLNNDAVSDQPQQVTCDNTVTRESQNILSNGFHVGLDEAEHSSHTEDLFQRADLQSLEQMESPNVQTLATKFEPKPADNSFLRRTQSLKKNFKVDSKFSVVKSTPLINGESFSDPNHEDEPSIDEGHLNIPGESGSEQTASGNSPSPSDDTIHLTSSDSSVDKRLLNEAPIAAADINSNDEELYSASRSHQKLYRLSLSIGSTQETTDQLSAAALQLDKELSHSRPIMSSESLSYIHVSRMEQPTNIGGNVSADSGSPELELTKTPDEVLQTGNVDGLSKFNCKQAPINIRRGNIDTKFYGDSDEDTSVHEARVQSFKDSYKRLSAANSKFKLLNDVIQENANGPISKPGSKIQIPTSKEISGSSTSNEFRTSADQVQPTSISLSSSKQSLENIGRKSSEASIIWDNVQSRDPDAQWRLDYTNIHVDTDIESLAMSSVSCDGQGGGEGGDSQPPSRRLSCFSNGSDMKDQRLNQFLRDTASSFSSQFGQSSEEDKQMGFLSTSMLSGCNSVSWSSYDEISTPPQGDGDSVKYRLPRTRAYNMESRTTSIASTIDMYGSTDLSLLSKNKISDKPVKWLVATESQGKPVVLSFSGSHSDDEAVLIWSREANETLWTNAPVLEYNPTTRMATLPSYMRPQLSNCASARTSPHIRLTSQNSN